MSQLELILQRVGAFGKWQRVQFAILAPSAIFISWQSLLYIFISYVSLDQPCDYNATLRESCNNKSNCENVDKTFSSTILTEWPQICWHPILKANVQSAFFIGFILGVLCFYQVAKRFGRKRTALICIIFQTICGSVGYFSEFYPLFVGLRFFSGIFIGGLQLAMTYISFEMTGRVYHPWLLCLWNSASAVGYILLTAIAASFSQWGFIYMISSVLIIALMSYSCLVPESAKWLLMKGRKADTERLLRKMAVANGHILRHETVQLNAKEISSYRRYTRKHITNDRHMVFLSTVVLILWILHEFAYYVISLTLPRIDSRLIFTVHVLSGFVEFPAIFASLICIKLIRRRLSIAIGCGLCVVCCVLSATIPQNFPLLVVLSSLVGKFGLYSSFTVLQVLTVELYPDELRLMMLITFLTASKIGALVAPYIEITLDMLPFLPFVCVSIASCCALMLVFFIPETFGREIYGMDEPKAGNNNNEEETSEVLTAKPEKEDEMEEQIELAEIMRKTSIAADEENIVVA